MECRACGYKDTYSSGGTFPQEMPEPEGPFVELTVYGKAFAISAIAPGSHALEARTVEMRNPVPAFACPRCGTVRVEVGK